MRLGFHPQDIIKGDRDIKKENEKISLYVKKRSPKTLVVGLFGAAAQKGKKSDKKEALINRQN